MPRVGQSPGDLPKYFLSAANIRHPDLGNRHDWNAALSKEMREKRDRVRGPPDP